MTNYEEGRKKAALNWQARRIMVYSSDHVSAFNSGFDACLESSLVKELVEALSECEGHFLSIELDYGAEVGNTPKMIASNGLESVRQALAKIKGGSDE